MLAQLHMGTLALHVETGRYRNVPLNRRFCFHCPDQIEDEIHFVFDCTLYTEYTIWVEIYQTYHTMINLNYFFMNFQDSYAKYICKSFTKRKYLLHDMNLI